MSDAENKTRVQLDLTPKVMALLTGLKERTEAASYAEVVRNALKVYDCLVTHDGEDARLVLRRPDGTTETIRLFL